MGKAMIKYVIPIFALALMTYYTFVVENRALSQEIAQAKTQTTKRYTTRANSPIRWGGGNDGKSTGRGVSCYGIAKNTIAFSLNLFNLIRHKIGERR